MGKTMRLDKLLAHMGIGTRSDIRKLARQGRITRNGVTASDPGMHVDPGEDQIAVDGERVVYQDYIYIMLNKPAGVISATEDRRDRTVLDLLDERMRAFAPFPVGRLDKDTEGLLLLTNDGQLAHNLLSPRKHVDKTYYAEIDGPVGQREQEAFRQGVELDDGYVTMPAELEVLGSSEDGAKIELTIREGKFHQVKRMFEAVGRKVQYLKRLRMGTLVLDEALAPGTSRELTDEEVDQLKQINKP
ncbi:rRNA pseudouridine synthase [Xylanibacillus composti]|uniref:Pseudouridine synthase n=1 Tax=Xylanibacillus composti TaxID=1572762 RepID=A0A8J4H7A9_9BACL|nr:pseudouridine synthase [Xylanibacillus composti]MDT9724998.1 rRNA pseudouridine synthase [Xylanibacillus composti]GIQ71291.1 pseudouridine synthase [Xylanibacillus composti]